MTTPERAPAQRFVVRRGQLGTFALLARTFAHDPHVEIIWDRREAERRQALRPAVSNRRQHERRRWPPVQWEHLNYLVMTEAGERL